MHSSVRLQCRILAFLALWLLFITQNIGIYVFMLHTPPSFKANLVMLVMHSAGMVGCALFMPFLLARGKGFLSPLSLLLMLIAPLILASHGPAWQGGMVALSLRALAVGIFWPLALSAFFEVTPQGSRGLLLGLLIAAGELIWIGMLPFLEISLSSPPSQAIVTFMHKIQIVAQCAIALALAAFFALKTKDDHSAPELARTDLPFGLPLLFVAAALLYIAYGLISGMAFPKITRAVTSENAHIALLLAMPMAGALLDRGGRALLAVLCCLALIAPAMLFIQNTETQEVLYIALYTGRQSVLLATLLLADRLTRNRKHLPLFFALAYILVSVGSVVGNVMAHAVGDSTLKGAFAIGLVLAFAALLMHLRNALSGLPLARDKDALVVEPSLPFKVDPARLVAFAAANGLSKQETSVMEMLAQGRSTEDIARSMNVAEGTVRTYVHRLMQKTDAPNRAMLVSLFAAEGPDPAEASEYGSR